MADTLEIFGVEYTGVTGIIATTPNETDLTYIRPQGTKSISANGTGIDVAEYASVDVNVSAPSPTLQSKTYTVDSAGTETITADSGYDGLSSVSVSVPSASPFMGTSSETFVTEEGQRMWKANVFTEVDVSEGDIEGWLPDGYHQDYSFTKMAVPSNTTITPTTSAQTIGGANYMMEGAVTVAAMPTGTAGTPTATKGTVSNHSVSVTPSVTNTAGYISGGTINGTAVTVSASELVSGSDTVTTNDTYDVTNLAQLIVNVSGSGGLEYETGTLTLSSDASSPIVMFSDTHTDVPCYINVVDATGTTATSNSNLYWTFMNWYTPFDAIIKTTNSANLYGRYQYGYKSSSGASAGNIDCTNTGSSSGGLYYLVSTDRFGPYCGSTNRYWRSGRTYKWIAVWAPPTT